MSKFKKIFYWYFSKKTLPYWCIFLTDCLFVYVSLFMVYIFNEVAAPVAPFWPLVGTLFIYLLFFIVGFRIFHTYAGILRYSSFVDLQRIAFAMLLGLALSFIFKYTVGNYEPFVSIRTRDLILGALSAMILMWGLRVLVKYLYDLLYSRSNAQKVFILGVKAGGISIAKSLRNQDPANYVLAGFTSESVEMVDKVLMGVKVYPFNDTIIEVMKNNHVKALFVSPLRSEVLRNNQEMVDALIDAGIKIFMMPTEQQWDGKSDIVHQQLHEVSIEDLLPRAQIQVDLDRIGKQLKGRRTLITGAAGSIGSEIVRQVASFGPEELILIDQAETPLHDIRLMMAKDFPAIKCQTIVSDIANKSYMTQIFEANRPDYVFHAAAYKHVPMMEDNPRESISNNVEGTRIIADLAVSCGAKKFVMISTDKAVNPTNVMGASKRICEIYVQSLDKAIKDKKVKGETQFVTTRFGNVLGSNGSVIPLFKDQIKNGGPLTVTHPDIIRYFMLIPEACKLVLEAGTMGNGGEIFVFDMGKPVKIIDLAKRMIQLSGANCDIKITGLRDGEKLYEEVLNDAEITLPTFHPKIKIAKVREYDYFEVKDMIDGLVKSGVSDDDMVIVAHMKTIVPEFRSQNSKYSALDNA